MNLPPTATNEKVAPPLVALKAALPHLFPVELFTAALKKVGAPHGQGAAIRLQEAVFVAVTDPRWYDSHSATAGTLREAILLEVELQASRLGTPAQNVGHLTETLHIVEERSGYAAIEAIPPRDLKVILAAPREGDPLKHYAIEHKPSGHRYEGHGETLEQAKAMAMEALRTGVCQ